MSKRKNTAKLFDDDSGDEDGGEPQRSESFHVNDKYAIAYDKWRQKEEFQKLKDRYGDVSLADEDGTSSSEEDDSPFEDLTPAEERDFLKKLSIIKSGQYVDYKSSTSESDDEKDSRSAEATTISKPLKKKPKNEPMYLKDYERRLILEREGRLSDDEDDDDRHSEAEHKNRKFKTFAEEQKEIKESFKSALDDDMGDDDFLRARQKTTQEEAQEEEDYLQWLKGQKDILPDDKTATKLKPLRDYWKDPNLDEGERFLRDYILNRQYLDDEDGNEDGARIPSYDEIVNEDEVNLEEDEAELDRQEEFEHKYNFRFEEPDAEFVKTYPRTVADSLRRKDDKRKQKRDDYKKRKEEEKKKQVEELKHLKNLKRREIVGKLEKLRRTAGIDKLPVDIKELEDDFDPEEYDRLMQQAFGEDYYGTGDSAEEKPQFSDDDDDGSVPEADIDEDGDMANWDQWTGRTNPDTNESNEVIDDNQPGTSGVDYGKAGIATKDLLGKKKGKRMSLLAQALAKKKPVFDPTEKKFEQYFDEYYKLDFEDVIGGDVRCRFKYRDVPANDFGLSVQEILSAKDKELNAWVSVKKMSQYRTKQEEIYDQKAYQSKNRDATKKQRLLHSVYGEKAAMDEENTSFSKETASAPRREISDQKSATVAPSTEIKKKKRKKKKNKNKSTAEPPQLTQAPPAAKGVGKKRNRKKNKGKGDKADFEERKTNLVERLSNERLAAYGVNPKKLKNRVKYSKSRKF